jgi:hypothetical protein
MLVICRAIARVALLVACGFALASQSVLAQGFAPGAADENARPAQQNIVVRAASGQLRLQGQFEAIRGRLAPDDASYRSVGAGVARATYISPVKQRGYYEVFLWWPEGIEGAGSADVLVHSTGGIARRTVDQSVLSGQWNSLGIFELEPGAAPVEMVSRPGFSLVVDAMRMTFLGTEPPPLQIRDPAIPILAVNAPFSASLPAVGGRAPYVWSLLEGPLPSGVSLDPVGGMLAGQPLATGHFEITLRVTDAAGAIVDEPLSLDIVETLGSAATEKSATTQVASAPVAKAGVSPDLSALVGILAATPEGGWARVNLNKFSDVWAPAELRPLKALSNPTPDRIILAWSSFAWDSNRGDLWLYGGGHANYSGNDVYRWHATSRLWERASLPSEIKQDDLGNWNAIDGADNAPSSAHTYDNNIFFPLIDRLVVFGGAAYNNGGTYMREVTPTTSRKTGPYLFDPNKADGDKVGGITGSHVQRVSPHSEVVGGNMWQNRDAWINVTATLPASHLAGCTAYAQENGRDVAYVGANSGSTALALYRFSITNVNDPTTDTWTQVGRYWNAGSDQPSCGYDPIRKLFVRIASNNGYPFAYWDLNTAAPANKDVLVAPTDPTGEFNQLISSGALRPRMCGFDFDAARNQFALWCGDGRVWMLQPSQPPITASGWTIVKQPSPVGAVPNGDQGSGIIGKWKYIQELDAFMGLQDAIAGNIWLYKPIGWHSPAGGGNAPPSISITSPASDATIPAGEAVDITTSSFDGDGFVARVEFFNGSTKIGESLGQPFSFQWLNPPPGRAVLSALATDDAGAQALSSGIPITIQAASSGTVVLQDGTNGYGLTRDTYLSSYHQAANFGSSVTEINQKDSYTNLFRFAIFASEGGPVPDGAVIQSAIFGVYKASSYNVVFNLHRMLKDWSETGATWLQRLPGSPWGAPGALGADIDYASTPDAQASIGWDPGWVQFDVTTAVQAFATGQPNYGWRVRGTSGNLSNNKYFNTREYASDPSLRPKLTIQYAQ